MTSPTTSAALASNLPLMNLRGSRPCILPCMNRRMLTITVTLSLDDDLCNAADHPSRQSPGTYQDAIDAVRATVAHDVAAQLAPLDPGVAQVTVTYDGVVSLGDSAISADLDTREIPVLDREDRQVLDQHG